MARAWRDYRNDSRDVGEDEKKVGSICAHISRKKSVPAVEDET